MDIGDDAFPEGIMINCIIGSDVYIYAVNNNISYSETDIRDYTFNVNYNEAIYNGYYMYMANSSQNHSAGHIHYYVGGRTNKDGTNGGDGNTGFGIFDDGDGRYISCGVGRFHTSKRNAYFVLEELPTISNSIDTVFQTDIRFDANDGRKAKILIFDTAELTYWGRNNILVTVPIDTVSETLLAEQHDMTVEEDRWYTYKIICHNGKYYRSFAPRGEKADCIELGECSSQFGAIRFDFMAADDSAGIGNDQRASVSLDNTKVYTNTEIADLTLEITDKNGNVIPNAGITFDGTAHTADKNGIYSAELMSGLYDVTVSADGYETTELSLAVFKNNLKKTIVLSPVLYPLESISFRKDNIALKEGQTATAELVTVPENADETEFNYSSSDDGVATVDANGVITAVKAGTATITAVSADNAEIKAECTVTVY
ncbi:MAG: Ig-like domain-containing protein, partial [Clostridia bacterium]|nr:Ig-like domain-containing protein [Clostridia bacterium]